MGENTTVIVTPEPEAVETPLENPTAETAVAAEAVVVAAETAIALAEGQAALAIQDAAEREQELSEDVSDLEEQVEEIAEQEETQDRSLNELWLENQEMRTRLDRMQEILENLNSSTQQPPLETPELTPELAEVIENSETTSPLTLSDTLAPTNETPMVATLGSADESPVLEVKVERKRRRILI